MLVGSVGVTVNRHFCMGELKSLSLFGKAEACEMDRPAPAACPMHATATKKKGCCDDEHEFVKWDDDRQAAEYAPLPRLAWTFPNPPAANFPDVPLHLRARRNKRFENYRPPPLLIDVPIHWQVFRL